MVLKYAVLYACVCRIDVIVIKPFLRTIRSSILYKDLNGLGLFRMILTLDLINYINLNFLIKGRRVYRPCGPSVSTHYAVNKMNCSLYISESDGVLSLFIRKVLVKPGKYI